MKSIQKAVKERDTLREECNTFSVHQMSFDSLESMAEAMREQDGHPSVSDLGKQLWDGNKESGSCKDCVLMKMSNPRGDYLR